MLLQRELHKDVKLLLFVPIHSGGLDARPGPTAAALHLAALHGEIDLVAAGISRDKAHFRAEHAIGETRELIGVIGWAVTADDQFLRECVFKFGDAGGVPGRADADFVVGAANPAEFRGVELSGCTAEKWIEGGTPAYRRKHRPVFR